MKYWDYTDVIQQFMKVSISNSFHSFHVIFEVKLDTNDRSLYRVDVHDVILCLTQHKDSLVHYF